MSTQKGNQKKKGKQKYQNRMAFKNDRNDSSGKMKAINNLTVGGVCDRCKDAIQWKIKYKKYKPLTQPKKCTKCSQKTVKYAYHIICATCAQESEVCAKCGVKAEAINPYGKSPEEQAAEDSLLEAELKMLSERKRRAFFRQHDKGSPDEGSGKEAQNSEYKEGDEEDVGDESGNEDETDAKECSKIDHCKSVPEEPSNNTDHLSHMVEDALHLEDNNLDSKSSRSANSCLPNNTKTNASVHFEEDVASK